MSYPALFPLVSSSPACTALLGTSPVRFWPFGHARQNETRPYAVHQLVYGSPENTLACTPQTDSYGVQVDCYALTASDAHAVADAVSAALEPHGYVVSWGGEFFEVDTKLYRVMFTFEIMQNRS